MPDALSRRRFLSAAALLGVAQRARPASAAEADPLAATAWLNGWLETRYDFWLARSPMEQAYLGLKTSFDKWDNIGEAHQLDDFDRVRKEHADLISNFDATALSPVGRLSYRLYDYRCQQIESDFPWRHHQYPVSQFEGWQQEIPSFLMNIHGVESVADAEAYIARLNGVPALMDQVIEQMKIGESAGVLAPKFAYAHVLRDCRNVLRGIPFDSGPSGNSPLWADASAKIDQLPVSAGIKQKLRADALKAMVTGVRSAFLKLIALCQEQASRAGTDDGAWKHPDGDAYYANRLAAHTTTDLSAAAIHELGKDEVARIHEEMRAIMLKVGFGGDLKGFFAHLRSDPRFVYPQTREGKAAYVARSEEIIAAMGARLAEVFMRLPRAKLVVKPVEAFREQSATAAFYQSPGAFDGRPGTYYINTYDMKAISKFEMEALAYHEAIPGHHMQVAIAQELDDVPQFRRYSSYTAYDEGWGLYGERLTKDMGFYEDPYSDFGRLSSELWRACRLVVDTGLHMGATRWTRAQAIAYLSENTPNSPGDVVNSVERYIVFPGQATAYKIGMARILELRENARARLGAKFDLRGFHDAVLGAGSVPLPILGDIVDAWVGQQG